MQILVMGPGCPKCELAEKNVREAVAEAGVQADIRKVADFQEIAGYGVFATPAVVIDGQVRAVGSVPSRKDILGWLT